MSKKIVFGNDLVKELKKYGLNKIGEVPTKYKNGITTIYYMWSVVSNIDKLEYKTPYIEYTTDEETDGFIMGTMFPQGNDGLGTQFDTFEDVKYFIDNAEYSNKDLTESIKEGTDLKDILSIINNLDDDKLPSAMTFNYLSKWIKEYSKIYNLSIPKFDDYKNWNGKEWKIYFGTISNLPKPRKSMKERSQENEITVSELQDTVEYFCGLFEEKGELKGNALKDLKNAVERLEVFNAIGSIYQWGVEVLNKCGVKYNGMKESLKEGKNAKKSLEIIRRKLMELINDDTIQEEFNDIWWEDNGIYDSVDDMFEVSVHNVLNSLLKENTIAIIPF